MGPRVGARSDGRVGNCIALAASSARAVDGVLEINQTIVMAAGGFPYSITQPGSYILTGNLAVSAAGTNAINVWPRQ